jgi:hypothetical protein
MVTSHERSVEIDVPATRAYAALCDVTHYPRFLRGVDAVRRLEDGELEFAACGRTWRAVLTEMIADTSVGWTSRGGPHHSGLLALEQVTADRTRVTLRIDEEAGATGPGDPTADLGGLAEVAGAGPPTPGARRLLSAAALLDRPVTDPLGAPIGEVRDAHIDLDDHVVTSIAVSTGALDVAHLVPVPGLPLDEATRGVSLPHPAEMIRDAPLVEPGVEPDADLLAAAERHFADPDGWAARRAAGHDHRGTPAPVPALQDVIDSGGAAAGAPAPTPEIAEATHRPPDGPPGA